MKQIRKVSDPGLDELCQQLAAATVSNDPTGFPADKIQMCGDYGVFRWFLPEEVGGFGWDGQAIARGYLKLAGACMTTTFIITQRTAACLRLVSTGNEQLKRELLPRLASGELFATVGISHLTTSRRHVAKPVLEARLTGDQILLDGYSPWVTGSIAADYFVMGATMEDGQQILFSLPARSPGVTVDPGHQLLALSASHTGAVRCDQVQIDRRYLIAGPKPDVMTSGTGGGTGGFQTSTLAVGLSRSAVDFLEQESGNRSELVPIFESMAAQQEALENELSLAVAGDASCSREELRTRANSLVLRSTQAALAAAKGAGYVEGHPAGRWCREALFFLVWSCPPQVLNNNLCELANLQA